MQVGLFSAPSGFSLAHCVSSDLRMSCIACNFRTAFGHFQKLKRQNPTVGDYYNCTLMDDIYFILLLKGNIFKQN